MAGVAPLVYPMKACLCRMETGGNYESMAMDVEVLDQNHNIVIVPCASASQ